MEKRPVEIMCGFQKGKTAQTIFWAFCEKEKIKLDETSCTQHTIIYYLSLATFWCVGEQHVFPEIFFFKFMYVTTI